MVYLFVIVLIGVLAGRFDCNIYIIFPIILLSLFLFFKFTKSRHKIISLAIFLFCSSFLNMSISNRDFYNDNEQINNIFIVKNKKGNSYILKDKKYKKNVKAYINKNFKIGDKILINGNIKHFHLEMNEYGFNEQNINKSNNIFYKLKINNVKKIESGNILNSLQNSFIKHCENSLDKYLNRENSKIMKSIILADTTYIDFETKESFRNIGLSHILALSGLHIMVIMSFLEIVLSLFKVSKIKRRIVSLFFVYIYIYFVALPIGAIRSFIMSVFLFLNFLFKRKYNSIDGLFLSGIINIFINPYVIYSVSFILSYASVLSILLFYNRLNAYFNENYVISSVILTLSVSILLFPINQYYFGEFSLLSFASNLLLVPIFTVSIILSFILIILNFLGIFISPFLNLILNLSRVIIKFINEFNYLNIQIRNFTIYSLLSYYVIIFTIFNIRKLSGFLILRNVFIFYLLFVFIFNIIFMYTDNNLYVDFLYVDQGDCSLISYKNKRYLVDTGGSYLKNYSPGKIYTYDYLKKHYISKIDALFISHFDEDHIEGIFDIIENIKIDRVYVSYIEDNEYLRKILEKDINLYLLKKDDIVKINENIYFKVLTDAKKYNNDNDKSLVLSLNFNDKSILYTGDISENVEKDISGKFDILKVSHHGSKTSTSEEFLKNTDINYATISCGINNMYKHPSKEVLERLKRNSIDTYTTSEDGQIRAVIGSEIDIYTYSNYNKDLENILLIVFEFLIIYLYLYKTRYLWITKIFID